MCHVYERLHKCAQNLCATLKLKVPEGDHEASSTLGTHGLTSEPHCRLVLFCWVLGIFVFKEKHCSDYTENIRHHHTKY